MRLFGTKPPAPVPAPVEPRRPAPAKPGVPATVGARPARLVPTEGRPSSAPVPAAQRPSPRPIPVRAEEEDLVVPGFGTDDEQVPRRAQANPLQRARPAPSAAVFKDPSGDDRRIVKEPTEDDLNRIAEYRGKLLSCDLIGKQRQVIAAFEDGRLLVAKSEASSGTVTSARMLLEREGFRHVQILHVPLQVIREVYANHERRAGNVDRSRDRETANMQRAVLALIKDASGMRCSDIHLDVKHHEAKIRVRSDGVMMELRDLPSPQAHDLCQAAFNMADASDASYKPYEYQGARITSTKQRLPEGIQAVRLQFNPLPDGGRHLVMRLLPTQKEGSQKDVDELGYSQANVRSIRRMRDKPYGINIISGPTGSGKSTTLQRSLGATMREKRFEVSVITVEDPPEYEILGAIQLPVVNVKTEEERREAFRQAITASLRSDPDIVMIGEIRDAASASLAFQAAMTGHQVWGSLHANDAASILGRMLDLDVEIYKLTDPTLVTGLTGQRLVRQLCPTCRLTWSEGIELGLLGDEQAGVICERIPDAEATTRFAKPGGCDRCRARGYAGRTVVAETILPDQTFMDFIADKKKGDAVRYWLASLDGMTMLEHGITKMLRGEVDPRDLREKVGLIEDADPDRIVDYASRVRQELI